MKKLILLSIAILCVNLFSAFETIGDSDARTRAVGNASAAYNPRTGAVLGNPANLASLEKIGVTVSVFPRSITLSDGNLLTTVGTAAIPLKKIGATVGVGFNGLFVSADSSSLYNEMQIAGSFAKSINSSFLLGGTLLYQRWSVPGEANEGNSLAGWTVNANIGLVYRFSQEMALGVLGGNLLPVKSISSGDVDEKVSPLARIGIGYAKPKVAVVADIEYVIQTSSVNFRAGNEWLFFNQKFRLGYGLEVLGFSQIKPSLGVGYNIGPLTIDYAFAISFGVLNGGDHMLSLSFNF